MNAINAFKSIMMLYDFKLKPDSWKLLQEQGCDQREAQCLFNIHLVNSFNRWFVVVVVYLQSPKRIRVVRPLDKVGSTSSAIFTNSVSTS